MTDLAIMCWFQSGELNFDSSAVDTLFFVDEHVISGSGLTEVIFSYPAYTNLRLVPIHVSPFQNGDIEGYTIQSCSISYPGGVPTVRVFVEWPSSGLPIADGLLTVFFSGRGTAG